jgi:proteic killer suppression protein
MIKTFADKKTEGMFNGVIIKRVDLALQKKAIRRLRYINAATRIEDLIVPPSNQLEKLSGDLKAYYSIRVNNQWRIIFIWKDGNAYEVKFTDYH